MLTALWYECYFFFNSSIGVSGRLLCQEFVVIKILATVIKIEFAILAIVLFMLLSPFKVISNLVCKIGSKKGLNEESHR